MSEFLTYFNITIYKLRCIFVQIYGMKVRIEDQRIVYRLNETERDLLQENKSVSVKLSIGGEDIAYVLLLDKECKSLNYSYSKGIFTLHFPSAYLDRWESEKIGFEEKVDDLYLVVEKDLKRSKKR